MPNAERRAKVVEVKQAVGGQAKESPTGVDKAMQCAQEALEFKARDLVLLDVMGYSSFSDYFIICSGQSSRQVQGIADNLEASLKKKGFRPLGVEGRQEGQWVLMDYGDVIIHIFYEPVRAFYDLESLWSEAKKVRLEHDAANLADPDE